MSRNSRIPPNRAVVAYEDVRELGELFGQLVVALIAGFPADDFAQPGKDRHAKHEAGEQQMELGDDPDKVSTADIRDIAIRGRSLWGGFLSESDVRHPRPCQQCSTSGQEGGAARELAPVICDDLTLVHHCSHLVIRHDVICRFPPVFRLLAAQACRRSWESSP
jgi:hypothetical protein